MSNNVSFPPPQGVAPSFRKEDLIRQLSILGDLLNAGTLLIDVRRDDYEGGAIRGSLNIPAQSFPMNMATLFRLCQGDGVSVISRVMFYCGSCGSRGPRCAGWFMDYVAQRLAMDPTTPVPQVYILEGGIKGWVAGGPNYIQFMDGYVESYWQQILQAKTGEKRCAEPSTETVERTEDESSQAKRRRDEGDDVAMS